MLHDLTIKWEPNSYCNSRKMTLSLPVLAFCLHYYALSGIWLVSVCLVIWCMLVLMCVDSSGGGVYLGTFLL